MNKNLINNLLRNKKKKILESRILCIGDIILDHNIYGRIDRISPEAPVPIFLIEREVYQLGGVGNVAKNISSLGGKSAIFYLSNNEQSSKIINGLIQKDKNIKNLCMKINGFRVPIKSRYKNKSSHVIRVDNENTKFKLDMRSKKNILIKLNKEIKKYDLVILSDYNKGLLDKDLIQRIVKIAKQHNIKIIADPKKYDFSSYSNIDLVTPNQKELTDAAKKKSLNEKEIIDFSRKIIKKNNIKDLLITRSEHGMLLVNNDFVINYKANSKSVRDVTGAGDTVIGVLALMLSIGLSENNSVIIANYAAGLVIGKTGTESITFKELTN